MNLLEHLRYLLYQRGHTQSQGADPGSQIIGGLVHELLPRAASLIPVDTDELRARVAKMHVKVNHFDVNGSTSSKDGWNTFDVIVNDGMMIFLNYVANHFSSRFGFMQDGVPFEDSQAPWDKSVDLMISLMESFWEDTIVNRALDWETIPLTDNQNRMSLLLNFNALAFLVAHELGHVVLRLSNSRPEKRMVIKYLHLTNKEVFVEHFGHSRVSSIIDRYAEEIAADMLGLFMHMAVETEYYGRLVAYSGAEFFFICFKMLEDFRDAVLEHSPVSDSHPPTYLRMNFLRSTVEAPVTSNFFKVADGLQKMADHLLAACLAKARQSST